MNLYANYRIYLEAVGNKIEAYFRIFVETVYVVLILADLTEFVEASLQITARQRVATNVVSHSPRNNSLFLIHFLSHFSEQSLVSLHIPDITRHEPKRRTRYRQRFFFPSHQAIDSYAEVRMEGGGKEARFPIQRRWLSTLSTFSEIIT